MNKCIDIKTDTTPPPPHLDTKSVAMNIYQVCFLDGKNHFSPQFRAI